MNNVDLKTVVRLTGKSRLFFSLIVLAGTINHAQSAPKVILESSFLKETKTNQQQLTGKVLDSNGKPIAGVTITVKGTSKSTQSDASGSFTLDAKAGQVLVATSIGYKTKEAFVENSSVSIQMEADQSQLDEVVVVGYCCARERRPISSKWCAKSLRPYTG